MITRIIEKFREDIMKKSLQNILNISISDVLNDKKEFYINIPFISKKNNEIYLSVKFVYNYDPIYFNYLPPEINELINSYMNTTIYLVFCIKYPELFPFRSPIWSIIKCYSSIITSFNIKEYYQNKIDYHNKINKYLIGTPSIYPEKDILGFIIIINQIDNIFDEIKLN